MSTSISNTATQATTAPAHRSGGHQKARVDQSISSEVSSGTISAADGTALTQAFDSITSSLKSDQHAASASGTASGTRPTQHDPDAFKAKVDSLIGDQVSRGSLTSSQADELKSILSQNKSGDSSSASAQVKSRTTSGLLTDFIKTLQAAQNPNASGYGSNGSGSASQLSASLLLDFDA